MEWHRQPRGFRLLCWWYGLRDCFGILTFCPKCWLVLGNLNVGDFKIRFTSVFFLVPAIAYRGIRNYCHHFRLPSSADVRREMDYYHALYRRAEALAHDSAVSDLNVKTLKSGLALSLQTDLIWHGFAHVLRIYFPYELCSRLGSYPSVRCLFVDYLQFCDAHLGMATKVELHSRFEQFVLWKESALGERPDFVRRADTWPKRNCFQIITSGKLTSERYEEGALKSKELTRLATAFRQTLDHHLFNFNRAAAIAISTSNFAGVMSIMAMEAACLCYRLEVPDVSTKILPKLLKIATVGQAK